MCEMNKLELSQSISGFSVNYKLGETIWKEIDSKISLITENNITIGTITAWKDNVIPEQIIQEKYKLCLLIDEIILGMQFNKNTKLSKNDNNIIIYYVGEKKYYIETNSDVEYIIRSSRGEDIISIRGKLFELKGNIGLTTQEISIPYICPRIPITLERLILTFNQAVDFSNMHFNCEDEQLKRWFLIIEELYPNKNENKYVDVKCARDFVSHPICHLKKTVDFLTREFPESVYTNNVSGKSEAKFERNISTHIAFVSKYQNISREWATELVNQKIKETI